MAEFTLLELHLDDAEFTANAPFRRSDDDAETASRRPGSQAESSGADGTGSGRTLGLLALLALAVAVVVVLRGSTDDGDQ